MWWFQPASARTKTAWFSCRPFFRYKVPLGTEELQITAEFAAAFGVFKAIAPTAQGTTIIVTPPAGGSVLITDFIMAAKKSNTSVVTLQFEDDTNTEMLYSANLSNRELYFSHSVVGRIQGWVDARLEFVIATADVDVNITVGYVRLPNGLAFSEWNDLR